MKKIALRNVKVDNIITTVFLSGLGIALFYWALYTSVNIRVIGAVLGHSASKGFLCILGSIMLMMLVSKLINLLSLLKYGKLEIVMENDKIIIPIHKIFRGYSRLSISKDQLVQVRVVEGQKNDFPFYLNDKMGIMLGSIFGTMIPFSKIKPVDLAHKIQKWINEK